MTQRFSREQRTGARVAVELEVRLGRRVGNDVVAHTRNLSVGGARVVSARPLRVGEELRFGLALPPGGCHLSGRARVLRQHRGDTYALGFVGVTPADTGMLGAFVAANGGEPVD